MTNENQAAELVKVENEQVVTTSLVVAESFGKRHDNVMQSIEGLKKDVLTFKEMFREDKTPDSYGRDRKIYYINRDGFALLAMGFTGKKALQFKLEYINAFNKMEEQLKSQSTIPSYKIEDEIARAERWIEEEKQRRALVFKNETMKPKVEFYEKVMSSENVLTTTQIAKELGTYASKLNDALHKLGVQYKVGGQWVLYSPYQDKGYTKSVTSLDPQGKHDIPEDAAHVYTKWTHKGRQFIHELIKEKGITFK